jgi:hypothetical protein
VLVTATGRMNIDRSVASPGLLVDPEGLGPTDDCVGRKRAEITVVEGVLGLPIHQQDFARRNGAAAPLGRQGPAAPIPLERLAHRDAVDADGAVRAAGGLPGERKDALQERRACGQITAIGKEARQRFRRPDHDKFGDVSTPASCTA